MRSLLAVLFAYAVLAPEIGTAQSGTAVGAAVADSAPVAATATKKKKKGLFGKVKGLANNKIVRTVAKTALCTAVPGGQVIAGALDAVDKKSVSGAANAATGGGGGCTSGMAGMAAPGGRGAAGLSAAAAGALGARVPGAGLPGQPLTGMPGMAMSPEQLKQIQEQYAKMGMNPVQLRAMQQMMAGMAAGSRSEQATGGMAISPEQLQQAMERYRKMGIDPAQLAAMQQMMASVAAPSGEQALTAPAASAGSGAPPLTTEKGRLVLRQLPWTPGAETVRPGSESAFGLAMRELGAAMLATPKRYKVEARVEEQGGKAPNRLLARKRAEAVVAALQEQGIAAERMTVSDGGADKDPRIVIAKRK